MSHEIIQVQYDQLDTIAAQLGKQAEMQMATYERLTNAMSALQGSGWEGEGATAFFDEMDRDTLPALKRLENAFTEAQSAVLTIHTTMEEAEREAAQPFLSGMSISELFGGETDGMLISAFGNPNSNANSQALPESPALNDSMMARGIPFPIHSEKALPPNPLVESDTNKQFAPDYMINMVNTPYAGSGTPELSAAMYALAANPNDPEAALQQIATIRGKHISEIRHDYKQFQAVQAQAQAIAEQQGLSALPALSDENKLFMGSPRQLRYGQVLGDTFGIDPVFGALLNPTGGLVGPGNIPLSSDLQAVADFIYTEPQQQYHTIFHDAGGYLYNYHQTGPGYTYLNLDKLSPNAGNPKAGQIAGLEFWSRQLKNF